MRELRDGLTSADGVALLRSFPDPNGSIGVESDDRLAQIVGLVEGVPHGLELVASNASNDRSFIGKLLAVTEAPEAILERLVSRNYENLDDPSHHIVGLLAMARVPLPESAVPELLAGMVDPELAVATLGRLIDARTIAYEPKPSPAPGIVRLHPLDADFVRQTLLEDERSLQKQLDGQLADWYRAQRTPPASWRSASDVGPNVREFEHRWRAARDPHERTAALAPLAEAAVQISRKGEGRQLLTAITRVEKEITDPLGLLYLDKCRFAVEFFNGSLKNAEEIARSAIGRPTDGEGAALRAEMRQSLGAVLRHRGRTRESSEVLQQLLDEHDDAVERSTLVLALLELGLSLCYLGEWDRARSVADTLEALAGEDADAESRARVFDLRSLACLGDGDYAGAIAAATEGIAEYASTTSDDNIGYLQNVRGLAHLYRGEVEAAVAEFTEGMSVAERYGQRRLEGFCALNLAWCALARASWSEAETIALQAADCLTMADTSDSSIAAHLVSALRDQSRDHTTLTTILGAAARMSRQNADVYNPGDEEVSRLAAALAGR